MSLINKNPLDGKRVLITGGTGSLGTAIIRRGTVENWGCEFITLSRNETKVANARKEFPHVRCEIGDIRDIDWLNTIMPGVDVCIHAAAIKIVPIAEANAREAILTNVMGTLNVAQAAVEAGVERVVGIQTDKSCQSSTVYGHAKACAGALLREARSWGNTIFTQTKYGNVLGSNASILELLLKLKREDKPFTITDARCTRFWLTMDAAIDLVLLALEQENGNMVVPKAAASPVISLFKAVDPDREIIDVGIRAGEKVNELLIDSVEARHTVDMGDYFLVYPPQCEGSGNLPFGYEYSSDNPAKLLSVEDLRELMHLNERIN